MYGVVLARTRRVRTALGASANIRRTTSGALTRSSLRFAPGLPVSRSLAHCPSLTGRWALEEVLQGSQVVQARGARVPPADRPERPDPGDVRPAEPEGGGGAGDRRAAAEACTQTPRVVDCSVGCVRKCSLCYYWKHLGLNGSKCGSCDHDASPTVLQNNGLHRVIHVDLGDADVRSTFR
jgi:hypothetical protein